MNRDADRIDVRRDLLPSRSNHSLDFGDVVPEQATVAPRYLAKEPLFIGRARAFNPGDPVPAKHVETYGWDDLVEVEGHDTDDQPVASPAEEPAKSKGRRSR